jgi:hypothetical protein
MGEVWLLDDENLITIESGEKRYPENSLARLLKVCLKAIDYQPVKQLDQIRQYFDNRCMRLVHLLLNLGKEVTTLPLARLTQTPQHPAVAFAFAKLPLLYTCPVTAVYEH